MNAIGKSSVVFVTLSGLFWGGWILGSQTPEGQEAIARAYETYTEQQASANENLFDTTALRAIVCGDPRIEHADPKPCLAVIAGGLWVMLGPTVGAVFTQVLSEVLRVSIQGSATMQAIFGQGALALDTLIYGLLLILFIIYMPKGILGTLLEWRAKRSPPPAKALSSEVGTGSR